MKGRRCMVHISTTFRSSDRVLWAGRWMLERLYVLEPQRLFCGWDERVEVGVVADCVVCAMEEGGLRAGADGGCR